MGRISVTGFVGFGVFVCLWGGCYRKKIPSFSLSGKIRWQTQKTPVQWQPLFFFIFFFHQGREQSWQEQDFLPQEAEIYTL